MEIYLWLFVMSVCDANRGLDKKNLIGRKEISPVAIQTRVQNTARDGFGCSTVNRYCGHAVKKHAVMQLKKKCLHHA